MTCFRTQKAYKITYPDGTVEMKFKQPEGAEIYETFELPCGKCIGCKLDKANDIATRCWCESKQWKNCCFITLTYNEENLPENGYLEKEHLQKFMKLLRYYENGFESWINPQTEKEEYPIRFYAVGEYGPNGTRRPHYHILIFNWKPKDLKFYKFNKDKEAIYTSATVKKIWKKGFITVEDFNYRTACYVSRYTTKKMFNEVKNKDLIKAKIQPEFTLCSKMPGIGINYWYENKNNILQNHGILLKIKDKIKLKKIPQYFERKYKEKDEIEFNKYKEQKIENGIKNWKEMLSKTTLSESEYKKMLENNLLEKAKILRRDNFI